MAKKFIPYADLDKFQRAMVDSVFGTERRNAAYKGYGLDVLVNDVDGRVRAAVARQGYGLDKLVSDTSCVVREAVADLGYGLDKLVNDPYSSVRAVVACRGYGLDKLAYDSNLDVCRCVGSYLVKKGYVNLSEWIAANPDKCVLEANRLLLGSRR